MTPGEAQPHRKGRNWLGSRPERRSLSAQQAAEPLELRMRRNGRTTDERCRNSSGGSRKAGPAARGARESRL
jgi:hypothetical protein